MTLSRNFKYNRSGSHKRAILHMIGQSVHVFGTKPSVADIAGWMNVHKTTAAKHLNSLVESGELIRTKEIYRPNVYKYLFELSYHRNLQFRNDLFKRDYAVYAQRVMKVVLTNE